MKIAILLATMLLTGCIETAPKQSKEQLDYSEEVFKGLVQNMLDCGAKNVGDVDDGISDASTVAIVLSRRCSAEYEMSHQYYARGKLDNEQQVRIFLNKAREVRSRVERFLPIVMRYRSLKKQNEQFFEKKDVEKNNDQKIEKI